jgi:hypothetical protein
MALHYLSGSLILTWNGSPQLPAVTIPVPAGAQTPGAVLTFAGQVSTAVGNTGAYPWSVSLTLTLSDTSTKQINASGTAYVVASDASPYGPGWGIAGVNQLVSTTGGVMWVTGAGDWRFFSGSDLPNSTFTSPAEDFGSLHRNGDQSYTYTAKDQTKINFDSSHRHLSRDMNRFAVRGHELLRV